MNRLLVALLSALDAVLAAAGGLAASLAPLTLLWIAALGTDADWGALWPASAVVWQLGHLVPVHIELPGSYLAAAGIDSAAAGFVLSLAPLGFATFTGWFAARSGGRAAAAGAPVTGAVSGSIVFAVVAGGVAVTGATPIAAVELWQALVLPVAVFAVPNALGAAIGAWRSGLGRAGRLRARLARHPAWAGVPGLAVRGTLIAVAGLVAVGGVVCAVAVLGRAGQVVALYEAGNVDAVGATVLALGQLAYLPTLVVWGLAFAAGPGFAVGVGSAVSPSGTQVGVVPGIPVLGAIPDSTSPWLLLLALLPVGVGAVTGWMLRSRLVADAPAHEPVAPRAVLAGAVAILSAALAGLFASAASGSLGPGRLAEVGPAPGPVALSVGLEVALGAAILLLAPRRAGERSAVAVESVPLERASVAAASARPTPLPLLREPLAGAPADPPPADALPSPLAEPETPLAEPEDEPGPSLATPDPDAVAPDEDAPDENPTEPIPGFERGSGGTGTRPDASVD